MIKTNVCLRHTKVGDELLDGEFDGYTIDIEDDDYALIIDDFSKSNEISDGVAASAVELIIAIANKGGKDTDEREQTAQYIACAVLRENFIKKFGADEIGDGVIAIMDETAVGGDITVWVNVEGEGAKFYVTLGRSDDDTSVH
jgi:hypothetical protein